MMKSVKRVKCRKGKIFSVALFLCIISFVLFLTCGIAGFNKAYAEGESVPRDRVALNTDVYQLNDNDGYNLSHGNKSYIFDKPYAEISLVVNGGSVLTGNKDKNGTDKYGYIMGGELNENKTSSVELRLKYNYNVTKNIGGSGWDISDDSWKKSVNGIENVGVVGTGALLVQKSYTGGNDASEWKWDNPYIYNGKTESFHTVDFTEHYAPKDYDGQPHEKIREIENEDGTKSYIDSDGYVTIYKPSGNDLNKGVYIKVSFAYELKYGYKRGRKTYWNYKNILEETKFYICNGAAEILYQNLIFNDTDNKAEIEGEVCRSDVERMAGTILNGHAANDGFRLNLGGNESYKVEYKKNESTNWIKTNDGALFTDAGKYQFRVTPTVGVPKITTIYINERGIQQNVASYFGDGIITASSRRVFSDEAIPVYLAGQTYYGIEPVDSNKMPLVGQIKRVKGQKIVDGDEEKVEDEYEIIATLSVDESRNGWGGTLNVAGEYVAEFANNPEYFGGVVSGDVYHFVFKFIVTDEASAPKVNENLLENNTCYFDYAAGYYGLEFTSQGDGKVIFAFPTYGYAFDYAYEYFRARVSTSGGKYIFQNAIYNNQTEVLGAVSRAAEKAIKRKYFDSTDKSSYLTLKNAGVNVLEQHWQNNIVVLSEQMLAYSSKSGDSFLNDKIYYTEENGHTETINVPIRFISVADFESGSVCLVHEGGNFTINIGYGEPVEAVLNGKNAPSGRYKIIEKDKFGGVNEYYAVYIKQGDLLTAVEMERSLNGLIENNTLNSRNAWTRFTADSFILRSAKNKLDPYGIVKITKEGEDGYVKIYQLDEVEDLIIDENGSYTVCLADRLGNFAEYYIDIVNAKKIYTLKMSGGSNFYSEKLISGGCSVELPVLGSEDSLKEFIGWKDKNGNILTGRYVFTESEDVVLEAVWRYKNTTVEVYDGNKIANFDVKPVSSVKLPEISRKGFDLYGFAYSEDNGSIRFYRGQITSVPDVTDMRLDAMWIDYNQTYTATVPERKGMEFVGWLYEKDGLSGLLLNGNEVEEGITVYALWLATGSSESAKAVMGTLLNSAAGGGIIGGISAAALLVVTAVALIIASRRRKKSALAISEPAVAAASVSGSPENARKIKHKFGWNFRYRKGLITAITAIFLCVLMLFTATFKLSSGVSFSIRTEAQKEQIKAQLQAVIDSNTKKPSDEYALLVNNALNRQTDEKQTQESKTEFNDDETFILANIYINLYSLGYDVFPANAVFGDVTVKGFAYCSYDEVFEKQGDSKLYIGCGFLPIFGEPQLAEKDIESGVEIEPIVEEGEKSSEYGFILSFEETFGPIHFIAHDKYITYKVKDYKIEYSIKENVASEYDLELGYLYNYDLEQPVYDPDLNGGTLTTVADAFSIIQGVDYDYALDSAHITIAQQNDNYVTVDTMQVLYISREAINEYMVHNQDESYLGIPAETLQQLESQLNDTLFYYVDGNGELQVAEVPPDPEPNIFKLIMSIIQITVGAILVVTGVGTAAGLMMMAGGIIGLLSDTLAEIMGGLGTISNGLNCLLIGIQCITCWPIGTAVGVVMIATGAATMAFGANDILKAVTGRNFIQEITGMSDQAYFWTNFGLNIASTVFSLSASFAKNKGLIRCFAAGTGVLTVTAAGKIEKKAIEDIKVGDLVISYNEETGQTEVKPVTETYVSGHEETVKVKHSGGQELTCSVGHRFFTARGWISAEDLRAGEILQLVNGEKVVVELVQHEILESPIPLYNFAVDGNHNYYVAESVSAATHNFVLVHNDCEAMRRGREIHKNWEYPGGAVKEYSIPGGYGRADAVDVTNKIVYELKPFNANGWRMGWKQLDRYVNGLVHNLGGSADEWTKVLIMYFV